MATRRQMDLLTAVEQIVEKAQGSGFSSEFYRKAAIPIKYVAEKMDLTREQSVMMALFIENSDDTCIKISDLSECLGCRTTRIIKYMAEIWRKRSIPTHSEWLYPLTFDAGKGLKEA